MPTNSETTVTSASPDVGLRPGGPEYSKAIIALIAAGLASFNAMYATQALLPALTEQLHVSPASASLTVSAVTGMLAVAIIPASILSERFGRGRVMIISAIVATIIGVALSASPTIEILVAGRALQGIFVAGVPAVAMAWLAEEMSAESLPAAMGKYVAGTTIGGLLGRLVPAGVLELGSWRWALLATALLALVFAVVFAALLPSQRNFEPKTITIRSELTALAGHWRDRQIAGLYILAFLLMGVFVSLYNYLGFRLRSDFGFSEATIGLVFLIYLVGTWTSARAGTFASRIGRTAVVGIGIAAAGVGLLLTLSTVLPLVLLGMAVMTGGFFAAHSTASGWVGALAQSNRAEASSTYLFCYYLGSSALGYLSGLVFHHTSWGGLIIALLALLALAGGTLYGLVRGRR
ncbi:MFS transporter [Dietzia timorensis]|uniref:Inner membrane transport protein YnfM n=1 Tax=Dietzia timorensis TaxID=499555 RepID=A0A173LLB7_9ACTN|nr:MFS transporter [Dietzia timorensis]ANI92097.1 Inner membrane transport protein YnfM [Dietzia timorensis]